MVPSSLTISQITPAGGSPASAARSTAASVCPGRRSTPPSPARSGNTWPGRVSSCGSVAESARTPDRPGPVGRRDPGGDAVPGVDRDGEGRALAVLVDPAHRRQLEPVAVAARQRHADHARVYRMVNATSSGVASRGEDEVALVLPVLVVDHDDRRGRRRSRRRRARWCPKFGRRGHGHAHDAVPSVMSRRSLRACVVPRGRAGAQRTWGCRPLRG